MASVDDQNEEEKYSSDNESMKENGENLVESGDEVDDEEKSSSSDDDMSSSTDDDDEPFDGLAMLTRRSQKFADEYDSSDEEDLRNTIGNIPVSWYDDEKHIGYNLEGKQIGKPAKPSEIDQFLARTEDPDFYRKVKDRQTGQDVQLTDDQLETIANMQKGRYPEVGYNPYQPFVDFFTSEVMIHPVSNRPEHKRSFVPSKLDRLKVGRMVHAIKMGWMKPRKLKTEDEEETKYYDLWGSETSDDLSKSQQARMKMKIPAPKLPLPVHAESYNPPPEYLPNKKEEQEWLEQEPEERKRDFLPQKFNSLREVPAYATFINERFDRCLDLYLAPRQRKMKLNVDPKDLLPELPKPQDLQPFPTTLGLVLKGHTGYVRCLSIEPFHGQFIASGSDDKTIRIWELTTGRCVQVITVDDVVHSIAWNPNNKMTLILAAVGNELLLLNAGVGDKLKISNTEAALLALSDSASQQLDIPQGPTVWSIVEDEKRDLGYRFKMKFEKPVKHVTWHQNGDYFGSVCPDGGNTSVVVHQLSKLKSHTPFSKNKGLVQCVMFHRTRPLFFVATQKHVRIYDLAKQQLIKKLLTNCRWISSMAMHAKGDNIIVGSYDSRLSWFDLDLSTKPYKTFRHQKGAIRCVDFHNHYPLFASASDDGSVIVCHGRVYSDLLQNPLIVPVKILRGHKIIDQFGVLSCVFHPRQPWIVSGGADSTLRLYTY